MGRLIATVSVLFLPLRLAHELAHYAVASLETDDAQIGVEVFDGRAIAVWPPLESRVVRVFAFLAPSVFGVILVALWLLTGVELSGWRLPFAIGVGLYTLPSPGDVRGACGLQEFQQETTQHNEPTE